MKHMAVIPARLESTRLEKKPLQRINSQPLISYVAQKVLETDLFDKVFVATDAQEIKNLFDSSPVEAIMTKVSHQSGTDRIYEASTQIKEDFDTIVNVQGDEPFVYQDDLKKIIAALEDGAGFCSLYEELQKEDLQDLNKVKVLLNDRSEAIYFSRFALPFSRVKEGDLRSDRLGKHIGVYAYTKNFLKSFCERPVGYFETYEKLEQLRALEMGEKVKMIYTPHDYHGVDTLEDLERVRKLLGSENES